MTVLGVADKIVTPTGSRHTIQTGAELEARILTDDIQNLFEKGEQC
jgi:hypothetical protein